MSSMGALLWRLRLSMVRSYTFTQERGGRVSQLCRLLRRSDSAYDGFSKE